MGTNRFGHRSMLTALAAAVVGANIMISPAHAANAAAPASGASNAATSAPQQTLTPENDGK